MEEEEDEEATGLISLLQGDISFQQWSGEHLSEIVRGAEIEDVEDELATGDEESEPGE